MKYYPIYHPSYILRNRSRYKDYVLGIKSILTNDYSHERIIVGRESLIQVLKDLWDSEEVVLDFETSGLGHNAQILGIGLGNGSKFYYVSLIHDNFGNLIEVKPLQEEEKVKLKRFLLSRRVWTYNLKFESQVCFFNIDKNVNWILHFDDVMALLKTAGIATNLKDAARTYAGESVWTEDIDRIGELVVRLDNYLKKYPTLRLSLEGKKSFIQLKSGDAIVNSDLELESSNLPPRDEKSLKEDLKVVKELKESLGPYLAEVLALMKAFSSHDQVDIRYAAIPLKVMGEYNISDLYATWKLLKIFWNQYEKWYEYYLDQERFSAIMESAGMHIDRNVAHELEQFYLKEVPKEICLTMNVPSVKEAIIRRKVEESTLKDLVSKLNINVPLGKLGSRKIKEIDNYLDRPEVQTVKEFVPQYEELIKHELEELIRRGIDGLVTLEEVKKWFNPNSTQEIVVLKPTFSTDEVLASAFLNYVNQNLYGGETRYTSKDFDRLDEIAEEVGKKDNKLLEEAINYSDVLNSGINSQFFEGWYWTFNKIFGLDVDNPETWKDLSPTTKMAWEALYHLRRAKKMFKNLSTYVRGILERSWITDTKGWNIPFRFVKPYDGSEGQIIYETKFFSCSADTKRWRSPVHTIPWGSEVRRMFTPRNPEGVMIHYDFSQHEIRVLAAIAGEEKLVEAFLKDPDLDIHRYNASLIWNKPPEEVTDAERRFSKMATFSLLYGKSPEAFAEEFMDGNLEGARDLFNRFYSSFPKIKDYVKRMHKMVQEVGYVPTIFGDPIFISEEQGRSIFTRAQNYPIQSSASSLAALGGMSLYKLCQRMGIRALPLAFTHDSLDWEVHAGDLGLFTELALTINQDGLFVKYGVPTKIDFEIGGNLDLMIEVDEISNSEDEVVIVGEGRVESLDYLVPRLENAWNSVEVNILSRKMKRIKAEELFISRRGFYIDAGKDVEFVKVEIRMRGKK